MNRSSIEIGRTLKGKLNIRPENSPCNTKVTRLFPAGGLFLWEVDFETQNGRRHGGKTVGVRNRISSALESKSVMAVWREAVI